MSHSSVNGLFKNNLVLIGLQHVAPPWMYWRMKYATVSCAFVVFYINELAESKEFLSPT